jgi:DNA-binding IclR family transcriptional regulator
MSVRRKWQDDPELERGAAEAPGAEKDRQFITALARGFEVLRAFDEGEPLLGNQEIARRTGLPKPTVSRITYTLTRLGYLTYVPKLERYRLGSGLLSLTHAYMASQAVRETARPHMAELAAAARATVALGERDRLSLVYIELQRAVSQVILHQDIGSRLPIARSAMGWAWLATAPEGLRRQVMDALRAEAGRDWPDVRRRIDTAAREVAETGFCVGIGPWMPDINGAGTAFLGPDGQTVYAFNLGGPAYVLPEARLREELGPRLVAMRRAVEADLLRRGAG